MGVKGLWSLLGPVARPIKLETLEGKRMAIDSSIWLYQFQATMRDKEGRVLVNAHVLGFLRRINKLLFHGIKPVFVFDGGAPNLKKSTIAERRRKKAGAAANHAKVAERLFAAQMRREAVKQAQAQREKQQASAEQRGEAEYGYRPEEGEAIPEGAEYLEELENDGPRNESTPARRRPTGENSPASRGGDVGEGSPATGAGAGAGSPSLDELGEQRRKQFRKHDPYRLPELPDNAFRPPTMGGSASGSKGSSSRGPGPGRASRLDPRLATEEELQHFIEEMRPEDLDFDSPEFHSLPTEVQYEIIGDLRIRSRQQSHKRLASMLQKAPTPLDFSKAQIAQLSQRNVLTQRLLTVTDTIGNSGLQIPVRVASERNREYVLVRNPEAEGGGWVLGVRDQGTEQAPIVVEESPRKKKKAQRARIVDGVLRREKRKHESDSEEASGDERDGEEKETDEDEVVPIPFTMDPDLRASRQKEFLDAIARRHTPKKAGGKQTYDQVIKAKPKQKESVPLFIEDDVEVENAEDGGDDAVDEFEEVQVNRVDTAHVPVEPPSSDVDMEEIEVEVPIPDLDLHAAMSESVIEALRRREEEDRALLAALRASKSDARLHFDAAERDGSIAETRSTMTESVKDLGSDDDDESMEEVPLEKTPGSITTAEPFSEVSPFFPPEPPVAGPSRTRVDSETSNKTVITSKDYARPPSPTLQSNGLLDMTDVPSTDDAAPLVNFLLVDPEVDGLQQTPKSKTKAQANDPFSTPLAKAEKQSTEPRSEARNFRAPIVNDRPLVTPAKVQPEQPQPQVQVPRPQEAIKRSAPSLAQVRATKTIEMPSVTVASKSTRGSEKQHQAQKDKAQTPASETQVAPTRRPFTASTSEPSPFIDVADKMDEETEANTNPKEQQIMSLPAPRSAETETEAEPIVQPDPGVAGTPDDKEEDMEWEASPPPASKQLSRNVSKALSDVQQQDNFDRALLRASRDPDEDEFDDSLSIRDDDDDSDDGLSEHERAEHRKGIFPAPPRDLAEDEGGVDMNAEGDDYARFLSQIKGRNLTEVRQEIDNEIRTLNQQNKVAMRDSEEITHQMVAQIQLMLRLFGIPYITAPMEAEAQCAELARLNLVDGVITDDNDVFLFGGTQCFKNLFNDAKYVECFIANDLDRELMLNRDRLISLAYLLGSDYTIGLPGVGPVVAMELMAEFPGPRGLEDFKQWWLEVQLGKDDTSIQTKFQKTFKKKFSNVIHIDPGWPNPLVRDAYNNPEVETSDEPFNWGFPDLNGLRGFLRTELSWSVSKVDDELTPIVQRIARRGQAGAMNKQTILDPFFDASLGKGMFAPRVRTKYPSKRLQAVIKMFREAEARIRGEVVPEHFGEMLADLEDEPLREIDPNDANQLNITGQDETGTKRKVSATKRKRTGAGEGEENEGVQKKAPRRRKTQDSENMADMDDGEATGSRSRASSNASTRGKRGKATGGGTRGSKTKRTRSTRSETTAQPVEGDNQMNVTGVQPVSSPLGDQGYDQLFLEIASDPVEPEDDHPARPKPRQRKNVDGPI